MSDDHCEATSKIITFITSVMDTCGDEFSQSDLEMIAGLLRIHNIIINVSQISSISEKIKGIIGIFHYLKFVGEKYPKAYLPIYKYISGQVNTYYTSELVDSHTVVCFDVWRRSPQLTDLETPEYIPTNKFIASLVVPNGMTSSAEVEETIRELYFPYVESTCVQSTDSPSTVSTHMDTTNGISSGDFITTIKETTKIFIMLCKMRGFVNRATYLKNLMNEINYENQFRTAILAHYMLMYEFNVTFT